MHLCTFSKSSILAGHILPECPLNLNRTTAKKCQCRKRLYGVPPADLRVLSCTYPVDWRGRPVIKPSPAVTLDMTDSSTPDTNAPEQKPFWGLVNGKPLKIRTMGATGPFGSGKSLLGDMIDPRSTFKIDIEASSTTTNLPFRRHAVLFDEVKAAGPVPTPLECFNWFREQMESVKPGEYTVVSVDPINEIQQGAYDWVIANPQAFGRSASQYEKMTALAWGDVKTLIEGMVGALSKKIETFYYTLHMGQVWRQGKPVEGKMKAKGSDIFRKIADVVFVLNRPVDPASGKVPDKPVGLVVGDIGKSRLVHANPDTGEIQPILPPQVVDLDAGKIREYIAKPPNYKKLKKHEVVSVHHMTDDEKLQLQAQIASDQREAEELKVTRGDMAAKAAERNRQAASEVIQDAPKPSEQDVAAKKEPPAEKEPSTEVGDGPFSKMTHEKRVFLVRSQFSELEKTAGLTRDQMVAAIEKRGGPGAKLSSLNAEQLKDLHGVLWNKLTARDLAQKK